MPKILHMRGMLKVLNYDIGRMLEDETISSKEVYNMILNKLENSLKDSRYYKIDWN